MGPIFLSLQKKIRLFEYYNKRMFGHGFTAFLRTSSAELVRKLTILGLVPRQDLNNRANSSDCIIFQNWPD